MGILDLSNQGMDDTPELVFLEKGTEVEVRIVNVTRDEDKNGTEYIMPFYEVINHPEADQIPEFSDYMPLPDSDETEKENMKRKRRLNDFAQAFNFSWAQPVNIPNDLKGKTGFVIVGYGESDDYGPQNKVRKYVTGA